MNQPFYIGEKVVAVDALPGSLIKNGRPYEISACHYSSNNGKMYWYVGVVGVNNNWMRPSIFASMETAIIMSFEKLNEEVPIHAN